MQVETTRFGRIEVRSDEIIRFPEGVPGFSDCCEWVLLADPRSEACVWMQSLSRPDVALALVSPRRFVAGYQARVGQRDLEPLRLRNLGQAEVLAIVCKTQHGLAVNLKAPVVINTTERLGRQVVAQDDFPLQYMIAAAPPAWKKTA